MPAAGPARPRSPGRRGEKPGDARGSLDMPGLARILLLDQVRALQHKLARLYAAATRDARPLFYCEPRIRMDVVKVRKNGKRWKGKT